MESQCASVLVVDDTEYNRDILSRQLIRMHHEVTTAEDGTEALELMRSHSFDLVLLDIMMPVMNGYEVLQLMKNDTALRHIPVIVISAVDDLESIVRCIKLGAEDYLTKPFNRVLLRARIGATLEKKWLHDQEQAYLEQIEEERQKSEQLLLNILPAPIAARLKAGERTIADNFEAVTVLFGDIVDFTPLSEKIPPKELVNSLNEIFTEFDRIVQQYELEKIKTVGDAYMVVGGLPKPQADHAERIAELAIEMLRVTQTFRYPDGSSFKIRIGINSGPVVAGVIGEIKFIYDLWGATVNIASRMESQGIVNNIQVTEETYSRLKHQYNFRERGFIDVKGKGQMKTYLLMGRL